MKRQLGTFSEYCPLRSEHFIQHRPHIWTEHKNSDPRGRMTAVKPLLGQFPLSYIRMFPATGVGWRAGPGSVLATQTVASHGNCPHTSIN